MKTETLYKKIGRKYVPVSAYWAEDNRMDRLQVGKFRLTYAYADGASRYEYDVTPDTAGFVAASMIAKHAMCEMIREKNTAGAWCKSNTYTQEQLSIIHEFVKRMSEAGAFRPVWWQHNSPHEIADAAIQTVMDYRP
jgi:hypothetical protein